MYTLSEAQKAIATIPAKINAKHFLKMVEENPSVFKDWNTPLEIEGFVNCQNSEITHLSPHLTFLNHATFADCPNLENAAGTYYGAVSFAKSSIQSIDSKFRVFGETNDFTFTDNYPKGKGGLMLSTDFSHCKNLKNLNGNFAYPTRVTHCSIETLHNYTVENPERESTEIYGDFLTCPNLKNIEGWDLKKDIYVDSKLLAVEQIRVGVFDEFLSKEIPDKITRKEFLCLLQKNPSFCKDLTKPLTITGYVILTNHPITHLSKYLIFELGANFENCPKLKIATGKFLNPVSFKGNAIEEIQELEVYSEGALQDQEGEDFSPFNDELEAANFSDCQNLKAASGTFHGWVTFQNSGIQKIKNLETTMADSYGKYANLHGCKKLTQLDSWDLSKEIYIEPEKLEAEIKRRAALKQFIDKSKPEELPFL
jgi:hypothetical protein